MFSVYIILSNVYLKNNKIYYTQNYEETTTTENNDNFICYFASYKVIK